MTPRSRGRRASVMLALATVVSLPVAVGAQERCEPIAAATQRWSPPLDRHVSVHVRQVTVGEALKRIATEAGVRLSYSEDLLPRERRSCLAFDDIAAGDALAALLRPLGLEPVVAGEDHVVLTPRKVEPVRPLAPFVPPPPIFELDPVTVTARREDQSRVPAGINSVVIDRSALGAGWTGSLADALNAAVPGFLVWSDPSSPVARYASLRGASSFGMSAPKVYIDGIAVANPLLMARLAPETIDRIEVIRGPQGAALYGADAIAGVVNITTRRDISGSLQALVNSRVGMASSDYAEDPAFAQDHAISLGVGSNTKSALLNLSVGSTGAVVPGTSARHFGMDGTGRWVGEHTLLTTTLRLRSERTADVVSPLLTPVPSAPFGTHGHGAASNVSVPLGEPETTSLLQYTAGARASFTPSDIWTHDIVLGVDGYSIEGGLPGSGVNPAEVAAIRAAGASGLRGTASIASTASFQMDGGANGSLTLALDHSRLTLRGADPSALAHALGGTLVAGPVSPSVIASTLSSTGASARLDVQPFEQLAVTGGLRLERATNTTGFASHVLLPMLGATWQATDGFVETRLRAAYGKGIRWPFTPPLGRQWGRTVSLLGVPAEPEQQAGTEAALDVTVGGTVRLEVTRFDQRASGLTQPVAISPSRTSERSLHESMRSPRGSFGGYALQQLGAIRNRGWEAQASVERNRLSIGGAISLVDSRVSALAGAYDADLRIGDRMLGVPSRIVSANASWTTPRWSISTTAVRAGDWVDYDYLALAQETSPIAGAALRDYWIPYSGNTHINLVATRELRPGLALSLAINNLLDRQIGEPDNVSVVPGRTLSLAIRATF